MSVQAITWALKLKDQDLATGAKFLLVAIANYVNEEGICWPSQARLGEDTNQSDRTVRSHLAELEKIGYIIRSERRAGDKRMTDIIRLVPSNRQNQPVGTQPEKNVVSDRKKMSFGPENSSGEPIIEPSLEPSSPLTPPKGAGGATKNDGGKPKAKTGTAWDRLEDPYRQIFETAFWPAYLALARPNNPKETARQSWAKAIAKGGAATPDAILDGFRRFLAYIERKRDSEGERFSIEHAVPHAATWLNQRRWESDYGDAGGATAAGDPAKPRDQMTVKERWEADYLAWIAAGRDPATQPNAMAKEYAGL